MKLKNIIQDILNEEVSRILNEDFKSQRNNFISQINSPNADAIVDRYLNDFKEIKDNKYAVAANADLEGLNVKKGNDRFDIDKYKTFKELETFVDYVSGQVKVGSANFEDIKVDGKPIYEDKEVEIYYADTPRACIQYKGKLPYSWCVSRTDASNMFYNYRLKEHEPAFYFVKRKKAMDKEFSIWNTVGKVFGGNWNDKYHFFVIQVVKNADINNQTKNQYYVTSAANDGDKPMNWNNILEVAPELNGLQYVFTPKPLTEKEKEKINKYSKGLSDEEFAKLPYKEKEYYIAVYVKMDKHLTDNQFKNLPEDLKNKYVGLGVGLSDGQFDMIKDTKLLKRYADVTDKKFDAFFKAEYREVNMFVFQPSEFKYLNYDMLKKGELSFSHINKLFSYSKNKDEIAKMIINAKGDRLDSNDIGTLLKDLQNPIEIAKLIGMDKVNQYLSDLNRIWHLLDFNRSSDELAKMIINAKGDELDSFDINDLLRYTQNPYEIAKLIGMNKVNQYLSELEYSDIAYLLRSSKNPDEIVKLIINAKGDKLNSTEIKSLLPYSSNPDELAKMFISAKVDKLEYSDIADLLRYSKNKDEIVKLIINAKGDELDSIEVISLLPYSSNPDEIAKLIGMDKVNQSLSKLKYNDTADLLRYSKNPDEIVKLIINAKGDNLDYNLIIALIDNSQNPDEIAKLIINAKGDELDNYYYISKLLRLSYKPTKIAKLIGMDRVNQYLSELDWSEIRDLLRYSKNPDEIKKLLIQAGFDRSLIPESKKTIKKVLREYIK